VSRRRRQRVTNPITDRLGRGRIPDEELLADSLRLAKELGRRPSGNQVAAKGKYDPSVYQRRWGSIAAAYGDRVEARSHLINMSCGTVVPGHAIGGILT
jgi:hypothetical protein